jgi:multidrug resistance efflux pump
VPIFISSPTAGTIRNVNVNVGDEVTEGQLLSTIAVGFGPSTMYIPLRSPIDGVVVARGGNPGDTVSPGGRSDSSQGGGGGGGGSPSRPIVTLMDANDLWIEAPIDELQVGQVRPGQQVDVTINSLGQVLPGRVMSVGRASADASTQLRQGNASAGGTTRSGSTVVPVRIEVGYGDLPLFVGATASVRIRLQDQ